MDEKVYKTIGTVGGVALAMGIWILITGLVSGILLIVGSTNLLNKKKRLII